MNDIRQCSSMCSIQKDKGFWCVALILRKKPKQLLLIRAKDATNVVGELGVDDGDLVFAIHAFLLF